jgi:C-terminal processing protease CtpA/Prc
MRKTLLILTLLLGSLFITNAQEINTDSLKYELKIYREILENSHSGLNLYTSKESFDKLFTEANKKVENVKNLQDYFKIVGNIHTKINCGHSSVYYSLSEKETEELLASLFPARFSFLNKDLFIRETFSDIPAGSQVIKINNKTVKEIVEESFNLISSDGYNTTFKYRQLEQEFIVYLYYSLGKQKEYTVKYIDYNTGKEETKTVTSAKLEVFGEAPKVKGFDDIYKLEIKDNTTAILTVNSFSTETNKLTKKYFKFLKRSFKKLKKLGVKNLIIDIRENTGGNDGNDMELGSYIIKKPFKENKYRQLKTTDLLIYPEYVSEYLREMIQVDEDMTGKEMAKMMKKECEKEFGKTPSEDGFFYLKEENVIKKKPNKNSFAGQVYIMTSGNVFSGGGLFSALVRDKSDAIFVGEETGGGYYRHTGSIPLFYKLPYSELQFSIFTVINEQDVDQKLFPNGTGTRPHYKVYQTPTQMLEKKDAVLEKCMQLIKK